MKSMLFAMVKRVLDQPITITNKSMLTCVLDMMQVSGVVSFVISNCIVIATESNNVYKKLPPKYNIEWTTNI
jgi:hypothetical protein